MKFETRFEMRMPVSLREYLQRAAEREMITQAAVVRRLVAEDARRSERRDERAA
jgi:hypothetical protein